MYDNNYNNGMTDRIKYGFIVGLVIALLYYAITLITNTSPLSPKDTTTTKIQNN